MQYISTRGQTAPCGFIDALLTGLADDGGLLVPEQIPVVPPAELARWRKLNYPELALRIFSLFVNDEIPADELKKLVDDSYATFRAPDVTPLKRLNDQLYVLELFHGPTFAFKDIALQFMGNLYAYVSRKYGKLIHILGATSGDTGSAAIHGVRGKEGIKICILHPHGRVSEVQALQMMTVLDDNVLNLAVEGNFDDCQRMLKELFSDLGFKRKHSLRAVNSINIARILGQTVYYFYSYFRLTREDNTEQLHFSVPTGNFGDIFAGYLAKHMGLPLDRLILATNENNILERFVQTGTYRPGEFKSTNSPAMDIQVASNFERYLYYLYNGDAARVADAMQSLRDKGEIAVSAAELAVVQQDFAASEISDERCLNTIKKYADTYGYLLDPHTACGVAAYEQESVAAGEKCVSLATAHPAKFDEAIGACGLSQTPPPQIAGLFNREKRFEIIPNDARVLAERLSLFYQD